jgi:putative serine protease PepD
MRKGIHFRHQQSIIRFLQDRLRSQFWAMLILLCVLAVVAFAFILKPPAVPEPLAVALVQTPSSSGSGFLVTSELLVTAAKVVGSEQNVSVLFPKQQPIQGNVLFADVEHDVALVELKDEPTGLHPLPLGNSDIVASNEEITLIGYPAEVYTVMHPRLVRRSNEMFTLDVQSNPGNAGAPLLSKNDGTVIGMVVTPDLASSEQGKHRAIPINVIDRICRDRQRPIR